MVWLCNDLLRFGCGWESSWWCSGTADDFKSLSRLFGLVSKETLDPSFGGKRCSRRVSRSSLQFPRTARQRRTSDTVIEIDLSDSIIRFALRQLDAILVVVF